MLEFCLPNLFAQVYRQCLYGESFVGILFTRSFRLGLPPRSIRRKLCWNYVYPIFSLKCTGNVYAEKAMLELCLPNLFAQGYRQCLYGESYVRIMFTQYFRLSLPAMSMRRKLCWNSVYPIFSLRFTGNVYAEKAMLEFCLPNIFAQVYRQCLCGESYF